MEATHAYALVALIAFAGVLVILLSERERRRPWLIGRHLPRSFGLIDVPVSDLPGDAREPVEFLTETLMRLGFVPAHDPTSVSALQTKRDRLLVLPFVNSNESACFLMGIEASGAPISQLMLHIITPLSGGRRVETSTLQPLDVLVRPPNVDVQVVLDADSVEEIWSRHRLALTRYKRDEREPVEASRWATYAGDAYASWIQAAVRAQRLALDRNGQTYRVRSPPRSIV